MATLNIPLILWFVVVATMTIKLFRNDSKQVSHDRSSEMIGDSEDLMVCKREA